jgi:excisionase family DNA binding protein
MVVTFMKVRGWNMGMTTSQVARLLGVSTKSVVEWSNTGLLRSTRAASGWRYIEQEEVERFARERAKRFATARRRPAVGG